MIIIFDIYIYIFDYYCNRNKKTLTIITLKQLILHN